MRAKAWLFVAMVFVPAMVQASVVRGKLVYHGEPRGGISVALQGPTNRLYSPVRSGVDGLYVIQNVPAGAYVLHVWPGAGAPALTFQIRVQEPQTDVLPITLP